MKVNKTQTQYNAVKRTKKKPEMKTSTSIIHRLSSMKVQKADLFTFNYKIFNKITFLK